MENTEKKFDWKKHLKDSFKDFLKEMFSLLCIMIAIVLVFLTQTDKQLEAIFILFNEGDWAFLATTLIGLAAVGAVVEKILKVLFWLIKTPIVALMKKR